MPYVNTGLTERGPHITLIKAFITKDEERVDFNKSSKDINNLIRGLNSVPGAYCMLDDKVYNHVINPVSKYPSNYVKSVTVVGEDSSLCDIYSTYLYLLPVNEGLELVNNTAGIEAIWYIDRDNIVRSDGFNYE